MPPSLGFRTFADPPDDDPSRPGRDVAPGGLPRQLDPSAEPARLSRLSTLLVVAFAALLMLPALDGSFRVLTLHEVFAAQTAREMFQTGDWIIPHFAGVPRLNKPAGMYWLIAGFMSVFQSKAEWVVRLPSAIAGILTAVMVARLAARWLGEFTGLVAGLMQASFLYVAMQARLAEADMPQCAAVTLAMTAFATAIVNRPGTAGEPSRRRWLWLAFLFGLGTGLAVLFKGVGITFIVAGCLLWIVLSRRWRALGFMFHPVSLVPMILVAGAWPLAAWMRDPKILDVWYFETFRRAGGAIPDNDPWHIYLWSVPLLLLPWLPFAIRGLVHWVKSDRAARKILQAARTPVSERTREDPDPFRSGAEHPLSRPTLIARAGLSNRVTFLLAWFAGGMAILLVSLARHKHYAIPMLPPITLLAALGFTNWLQTSRRPSQKAARRMAGVAVATGAIAVAAILWKMPKAALQTAAIAGLIAIAVAAATLFHAARQLRRTTIACVAGAAVGVLGAQAFVIPAFDDYKAQTAVAREADRLTPPGEPVYLIALGQSQAAYYIDHPLKRIDARDPDKIAAALTAFQTDQRERYVLCPRSLTSKLTTWGQPQILAEVDHLRKTETDGIVFVRLIRDRLP
ncbi:ArnT family glycosyltransferase [Humisphaera borealis]|uniref:Glycosyltransferase family 39 protein n=1 Tax=Humisphaera borealis TaxID=2807512 RepID=A0A7M2X2V6_9BACT|nr:glycosyltransferase family 39 protein [Humisphaera borealis]QOV92015.1 glycosyltransferase family 39 protein [Humisphaera borealis]